MQSFKDFLRSKGLKTTKGREIILKEIETRKDHFNAENLYSSLSGRGAGVSRPTIYRTLKLLEQSHVIERLDIKKNSFYYEPAYNKKSHCHLICENCGKIIDFSSECLEILKLDLYKQKNFKPDNISIHVFGKCNSCKRASRNKNRIPDWQFS